MSIVIQMRRVYKARMTAVNAKSDWAREYWHSVADELEKTLESSG